MNYLSILVNDFKNNNETSLSVPSGFKLEPNAVTFNACEILTRVKGVVYITNNFSCKDMVIDTFNALDGFRASLKDGKIVVNGFEWDGKKTALNVFTD